MPPKTTGAGAGEALKRAEQSEQYLQKKWMELEEDLAMAKARWRQALENEDHDQLDSLAKAVKDAQLLCKEAHGMYDKSSKTMLGLEKGVSQEKRVEGDIMSQSAVENFAKMLIRYLRQGIESQLMAFCQDATKADYGSLVRDEVGSSIVLAELEYSSEMVGGNQVKIEFWKGELVALRRVKLVLENGPDLSKPTEIYKLFASGARGCIRQSLETGLAHNKYPGWMKRIIEDELGEKLEDQ